MAANSETFSQLRGQSKSLYKLCSATLDSDSKMRLTTLTTIALFMVASGMSASISQRPNDEIICSPSDSSDCYPKIFQPTKEWQVIKENQDIPAGLHVRLNLETSQREAKLLDPEDEEPLNAIVLSPEQEISAKVATEESLNQAKKNTKLILDIIKDKIMGSSSKKVSLEDVNTYQGAVDEVIAFHAGRSNKKRIDQALETLLELGHDIEFGVRLTGEKLIFQTLNSIITNLGPSDREKVYRIFVASLRNNPEAIDNFLSHDHDDLIQSWISDLDHKDDIVVKRLLGIFHQLLQAEKFQDKFKSINDKLIEIYPRLSDNTKTRILNIMEDSKLVGADEGGSDDSKVSTYIQNRLINSDFDNEEQFKLYYNKLVELHKSNKNIKGSDKFIEWLDAESGKRAEGIKARDNLYSGSDKDFDKKLLETRHTVFGNPNALRKHFDDEL